ncbi:carboxymuconolactone decarboxylase family protein [Ferrimonas pelagia]|uniref:Carboxymuconolactone decarboxylase family protein n=1 Tax=Ferrimonas pelagia TaxID=1177826 RepID=A0ABP9FKT3_9GAMM
MTQFPLFTLDNAPSGSQALLAQSLTDYGMVPNLHAVMALSPPVLEAYQQLHRLFMASSFTDAEKTVIWQTANRFHECHYCQPAHTAIAYQMGIEEAVILALKHNAPLPDPKLQVLHDLTLAIIGQRGHVSEAQLTSFYAAGFGAQQLLELLLGVTQKVLSNYTNHVAKTPLDEPFKAFV